jgi:hypothetical protein
MARADLREPDSFFENETESDVEQTVTPVYVLDVSPTGESTPSESRADVGISSSRRTLPGQPSLTAVPDSVSYKPRDQSEQNTSVEAKKRSIRFSV